ncbi:porin family protein [Flammeovirga sp. EKP202]|uniref:porin family protein n=1 Tax=Flammeovirga sp. EKP202 TaxID=2770592 RepID=UPI00165F4985|nr:porin family protein [Flammeovirga sp. EKP202]MBD0403155.1 PorT family protein [Flammeovirga sp. EKP202]
MKILKLMLFITILYCGQTNLFAQSSTFRGGIKGGINSTKIGGDASGLKPKVGFQIGGFMKYSISDYVAIQPEVMFSMQGAKSIKGDISLHYNYVNIPLIAKVYPDGKGFNIQAGPQLGLLASANVKGGDEKQDVSDQLNGTDFAFALGLGHDFNRLTIDLRYNIGISSTSDQGSYPNNVLQLGVGIFL